MSDWGLRGDVGRTVAGGGDSPEAKGRIEEVKERRFYQKHNVKHRLSVAGNGES